MAQIFPLDRKRAPGDSPSGKAILVDWIQKSVIVCPNPLLYFNENGGFMAPVWKILGRRPVG
jgi:hypothetical protein